MISLLMFDQRRLKSYVLILAEIELLNLIGTLDEIIELCCPDSNDSKLEN